MSKSSPPFGLLGLTREEKNPETFNFMRFTTCDTLGSHPRLANWKRAGATKGFRRQSAGGKDDVITNLIG